jgi:hypothetical protein
MGDPSRPSSPSSSSSSSSSHGRRAKRRGGRGGRDCDCTGGRGEGTNIARRDGNGTRVDDDGDRRMTNATNMTNAAAATTNAMTMPPAPSDFDELRSHYRFVLPDDDDDDDDVDRNEDTWQERMARRYHDQLYKEYVLADLSRAHACGKIGLRWRTEVEVRNGRGFRDCGNLHCPSSTSISTKPTMSSAEYAAEARRYVGIGVPENGGKLPMGMMFPIANVGGGGTATAAAVANDPLERYLRSCLMEKKEKGRRRERRDEGDYEEGEEDDGEGKVCGGWGNDSDDDDDDDDDEEGDGRDGVADADDRRRRRRRRRNAKRDDDERDRRSRHGDGDGRGGYQRRRRRRRDGDLHRHRKRRRERRDGSDCGGVSEPDDDNDDDDTNRCRRRRRHRLRQHRRRHPSKGRKDDEGEAREEEEEEEQEEEEQCETMRLSNVPHGIGLHDYEVDFAYVERGKSMRELVKARLCLRCAPLLFVARDFGGRGGSGSGAANDDDRDGAVVAVPATKARLAREEAAARSRALTNG